MADEPASTRYWKATSGFVYEEMIRVREQGGQLSYRRQEAWLTRLVLDEQRRLGRPLEVLEFGCGFGRHAAYLGTLPAVRYSGYDISEAMLAPLRGRLPPGVSPDDILCGPSLAASAGARRFDLVFTVSVLIHNPPERILPLLEEMHAQLRPGGFLCLVENQLVPFTVWENQWHDGCWLHAYPALLDRGWELTVVAGAVEPHHVYLLKRIEGASRFFVVEPGSERRSIEPAELTALGLPKLERWAAEAGRALQARAGSGPGREGELAEYARVTRGLIERRHGLPQLADSLAELRDRRRPQRSAPAARPAAPPRDGVLVDAPLDTQWAARDPRLGRVAHLFHQEWHGIRAAAGYLPGRKIAITTARPLTADEVRRAFDACTAPPLRHVVVHSSSENAALLLRLLRRHAGGAVRLHAVWHGTSAQFHHGPELDLLGELIALRRDGVLDSLGAVKPGLAQLSPSLHREVLLNLPPSSLVPPPRRAPGGAVLIPLPNDWRKNLFTNLFAADGARGVSRLNLVERVELPRELELRCRLVQSPRLDRWQLFRLLEQIDLVAHATLSECQPMTALEALALRVPCVTGPLSLGALDDHPYQRLAQVGVVDAIEPVRASFERMLAVPRDELEPMMDDYRATLERAALERWGTFLGA